MIPERFRPGADLIQKHGARVGRLGTFLLRADPLADEASAALSRLDRQEREALLARVLERPGAPKSAPAPVAALAESLHQVPLWVDFGSMERGGAALLRTGVFSGLVLALRSLVLGYCSPGGNKPLVFSGRLHEQAPRRLSETGRFLQAVCLPGGLRAGGAGFVAAARVRLMHAQVRRLLLASPRWSTGAWGVPINQMDMAGTLLLFSLAMADGLRALGVHLTAAEVSDLIHQWRYVGCLLGVDAELVPTSEAEARTLFELLEGTEGTPDSDSAALAHALMRTLAQPPRGSRRVAALSPPVLYGLSRLLIGEERAEALRYPKGPFRYAAPALRALVRGGDAVLRRLPLGERLMLEAGRAYWQRTLEVGLMGEPARFEMPERVRHA